jgi:hypothetical protein
MHYIEDEPSIHLNQTITYDDNTSESTLTLDTIYTKHYVEAFTNIVLATTIPRYEFRYMGNSNLKYQETDQNGVAQTMFPYITVRRGGTLYHLIPGPYFGVQYESYIFSSGFGDPKLIAGL